MDPDPGGQLMTNPDQDDKILPESLVAIQKICCQIGTVPSTSLKWIKLVWRIRDINPGSRILIFTHSGSRISDPGSKNSNKRER
jgi:hypothetical protein